MEGANQPRTFEVAPGKNGNQFMFVRLLFETVQLHVYIFKRLGGKTIKMNICTCYIMFKKYSDAEEIKWILEEDSLTLQPFQIQSSFFVNKSDEVLPNISLLML